MFTSLLIIYILATLTQLVFWSFIFPRIANYPINNHPKTSTEKQKPVSIIICARNEAENLKNNIPHFLNQNYRSFEIIVVNDNSSDNTSQILLDFQTKSPNLHIINLHGATLPGKKAALERGISAAHHDILLLSDADCYPSSPMWLQYMYLSIAGEKKIGLGFSPYMKEEGFLNIFIRLEAIYTAIQYFSFALIGMPYMGVGRNLIYYKSLFYQVNGFAKHKHLASGDDDLFINEVANATNTTIIIHPETFVVSKPKSSWRGYYHQKTRHLTTGTKYKAKHQIILGLLALSHFAHYVFGLTLLVWAPYAHFIVSLYLVRIIVVSIVSARILKKLESSDLLKWVPIFDAAFILYYILFAPILLIGNTEKWK